MGGSSRLGTSTVIHVASDTALDPDAAYKFSFKRLLQFMGPGILMSIAYVDPGNLESDLQVGAQAGYVLLWLLLLSTLMGLVVQLQAAKLGVVTGRHLAQHCRRQYPRLPRLVLWVMAEIAIIGSDVQEVIGSAIALSLLSGGRLPLWAGVLATAAVSFSLLFIERLGIRVLEGFFGGMVGVMVAAFGVMYARAGVPTEEVVRGFTLPSLPKKDLPVAVALMGSLIMPHNIYLHSALVQTRKLGSDRPAAKREAMLYFGIESALSLVVAVVINLFITAVFAAGFYGADLPDIGLQSAGRYLGDTYGGAVVYIWALGLLAAGQSSTMTGTYTGQFVMGGYLDLKVSPWARVAITRLVAIAPTLAVALLCGGANGDGDGSALDQLNQGLNLLQSIQLPFALVPVLTFTASPAVMGAAFANGPLLNGVCWAIAGLVVAINGLAVYQVAYEFVVADPWVSGLVLAAAVAGYLALVGYLVLGPQSQLAHWLGYHKGPQGEPFKDEDSGSSSGGSSGRSSMEGGCSSSSNRRTGGAATASAGAAAAAAAGASSSTGGSWQSAREGGLLSEQEEPLLLGAAVSVDDDVEGEVVAAQQRAAGCSCCPSCRCWAAVAAGGAGNGGAGGVCGCSKGGCGAVRGVMALVGKEGLEVGGGGGGGAVKAGAPAQVVVWGAADGKGGAGLQAVVVVREAMRARPTPQAQAAQQQQQQQQQQQSQQQQSQQQQQQQQGGRRRGGAQAQRHQPAVRVGGELSQPLLAGAEQEEEEEEEVEAEAGDAVLEEVEDEQQQGQGQGEPAAGRDTAVAPPRGRRQ
ncbi:hypothetical protein HYH02_008977 [Chlamydomonas schloesseri]|uniref:Uncharacterized protein n=1 Tax=Chlamydomonas schloesseri TaxID=2026947 RepID=A0A835WDB5_9CHLO|nr:hypothetical protein HYH02_008977 [Chlamydomonas schloesseri]|eukprot:KAG2445110.1 hypothetical protein HYH02_008977 [Chlamydomonas schloesseri]